MRGLRVLLFLFLSLLLAATVFGQTLGAVLTASQEVPPTTTPGFGNATVTFDAARANITVTITVANLGSPINNFHIHENVAGSNGPVIVNLIGLGGTFTNGTMTGTFPVASDVATRMLQNPQNFYVNVHTTAFPGGAVRGQLAFVSGGPTLYAAELRPGNEVPPTNSTASGSSLVTFDFINNTIAYQVTTTGIANPTLSHIHRNVAGANGPVIINFATSASQIAGGKTSGSGPLSTFQAAAFAASDLTALATAASAAGYYVNVHSQQFGGGEIRGQLTPANEYDIPIAGRVTNGLGQTFVTDVRIFNPSYTSGATALVEYFPSGTSPNTTASASAAVAIASRGTSVLDDIGTTLGVNGTTGAIRVASATPLVVTSRIYADLRSSGKGTQGQFAIAQPRANALRRGVMPQLVQSDDLTSGYRTNVGIFNPTNGPVTIRFELRSFDGALFDQQTVTVQALSHQQKSIVGFVPSAEHSHVDLTLSFDASAPVFVYAAVNDNVSADSILVPAQPDNGTAANQ